MVTQVGADEELRRRPGEQRLCTFVADSRRASSREEGHVENTRSGAGLREKLCAVACGAARRGGRRGGCEETEGAQSGAFLRSRRLPSLLETSSEHRATLARLSTPLLQLLVIKTKIPVRLQ